MIYKEKDEKIEYLGVDDDGYPQKLKSYLSNPEGIYYRGDLTLVEKRGIAVVGSRKCTAYGYEIAGEIGKAAARYDAVIISGMAMGIDAEAHRSILDSGGKTIGISGCGLDIIYPKQNRELYDRVIETGLLISEYPPGTKARHYHFPMRNRIISALADAVIVVEARARSGALITAECAVEQGKEVYGVPGNVTSIYSLGPNKLIREGARSLTNVDDIFRDLGFEEKVPKSDIRFGDEEKKIIDVLKSCTEISTGELCDKTGLSPGKVNSLISILEIKGLVYSELGKVMFANFL